MSLNLSFAVSSSVLCIYIYIYICTPLRKDTGVFESFGRFIIVSLD